LVKIYTFIQTQEPILPSIEPPLKITSLLIIPPGGIISKEVANEQAAIITCYYFNTL